MRRAGVLLSCTLLGACAPKGGSAGGSADSTATPAIDSAAIRRDSVMRDSVMRDSVMRDSAARADSIRAGSKALPAKPGAVIGRDSAFGPTYMVDSTGKLIPIPKKKP